MESEWFEFLIITLLLVDRVDWIAGKKDINHESTSIMLTFQIIDGTRGLQKDLRNTATVNYMATSLCISR